MWLFVPLIDTYMDTTSHQYLLRLPRAREDSGSRFAVVHSMSCSADDAVLGLTNNASPSCGGPQHAMVSRDVCPRCQAPKCTKNGPIHHGNPHHHGYGCGRQGVESFAHDRSAEERRAPIKRLLLERMSWRGSWRAVGVTCKWR